MTIHEAKTHLSRLIAAVERGEFLGDCLEIVAWWIPGARRPGCLGEVLVEVDGRPAF